MKELRNKINDLKEEIKEITKKFNKVISNLEAYYDMSDNIINNYEDNKKNCQILKSIINIYDYNKKIMNDIDSIIKEDILKNKVSYLADIYEKMIIKNEITIKYKVNNKNKIRLFGDLFINNNKDNFKIIIKGKECPLTPFIDINDKEVNDGIFKIKLRQIKNIIDISYMFSECEDLVSFENISKMDTSSVINMSGVFSQCKSLTSFSGISKWDTSNVKKMNNMFSYCSTLLSLPDISGWNVENVNDMSRMFYKCERLASSPDFSKWNTSKVTNMKSMFYNCCKLTIIKGIEKFNTNEVVHH